jgi:hypothetical protein
MVYSVSAPGLYVRARSALPPWLTLASASSRDYPGEQGVQAGEPLLVFVHIQKST